MTASVTAKPPRIPIRYARQTAFDTSNDLPSRPKPDHASGKRLKLSKPWMVHGRDVADRAAGEDAGFEIMTVDADELQRIVDQITLAFETEYIQHRAFDVVDAALQRAQGAFADRMNPSGVDQLIGAADDLVEHVFQPELVISMSVTIANWRVEGKRPLPQ